MRKVKLTVFGLMFCLLLHLTGCAAAQKPLRVTLVLKTVTEVAEFWGTLLSGVEKAAEEYGVELEVLTSPREIDIDKQIDLIRQVTEDKPDVMILSAADYDRCAEATEEAIAAGIGVVAIDTDVNAAGRACYVGSNNYQIGLEMGRAMTSYLPDGGKVAVIQHMLTTTTGIERTRGVLDALGEVGNIEIFGSFCCDNSTEQAQTITTELLSSSRPSSSSGRSTWATWPSNKPSVWQTENRLTILSKSPASLLHGRICTRRKIRSFCSLSCADASPTLRRRQVFCARFWKFLLTIACSPSIMLDVYQVIYIKHFILRRRSAGNGSEKQVYERRNDGGGTAGRTGKGNCRPDRKDDGGRVGYIYAADLHGLWLHGQRQAGGLCRCNARV